MTGVSWHLYLVVLDDVLLDNGVSGTKRRSLLNSTAVEVSFRNESVVAWDVGRSLRRSNGKLMMLVSLRLCITIQFSPWVVAVRANRLLELCDEIATLARVCLAVVTPQWAL